MGKKGYTFDIMYFSLIPHPSELLALAAEQKALLCKINSAFSQNVLFPSYPLWLPLDTEAAGTEKADSKKTIAALKKAISQVTIEKAVFDLEGLIFPASYTLDGHPYAGKIRAGIWADAENGSSIDSAGFQKNTTYQNILNSAQGIKNHPCSIFQLAEVQTEGTSYKAFNTVWVKIKK